jgi:hypothetical protein
LIFDVGQRFQTTKTLGTAQVEPVAWKRPPSFATGRELALELECLEERSENGKKTSEGALREFYSCITANKHFHTQLRLPVATRRDNIDWLCEINSKSGCTQALRKKTTDALDRAGCPPTTSDQKQGFE